MYYQEKQNLFDIQAFYEKGQKGKTVGVYKRYNMLSSKITFFTL